jgi:hypothetical protein
VASSTQHTRKSSRKRISPGNDRSKMSLPHKHCARCKAWLPFEAYRRNPKNKRYGLTSWCTSCMAENNRAWRAANSDYVATANEARRTAPSLLRCSECNRPFYGRPNRKTCSPVCRAARKVRTDPRWHSLTP